MWNDSLHVLYRFNDLRLPWVLIYMGQSFGRWRVIITLWTRNGKFTQSTGHSYQEVINGTSAPSCWPCVKFGWWKFGKVLVGCQFRQILAAPKFPSIQYCSMLSYQCIVLWLPQVWFRRRGHLTLMIFPWICCRLEFYNRRKLLMSKCTPS